MTCAGNEVGKFLFDRARAKERETGGICKCVCFSKNGFGYQMRMTPRAFWRAKTKGAREVNIKEVCTGVYLK